MKRQKSCGIYLGKLVHQLPGVIAFTYNLHFRCTIARWKFISYVYHGITCTWNWTSIKYPEPIDGSDGSSQSIGWICYLLVDNLILAICLGV
jgi:hypothetical protein